MLMEFPRFNGENPRQWIRKSNAFFNINPMTESDMVSFSTYHFDETASDWFTSTQIDENLDNLDWPRLQELVCHRFIDDVHEINLLFEYKNLKQTGSAHEYDVKFDELHAFVVDKYKDYWEKFYVDFYACGLSKEIRYGVLMHDPYTLSDAIRLARSQEYVLEMQMKGGYLGESWKSKLSSLSKSVDVTNVTKLELNVLMEYRNLKQTGSVKDYAVKFEELHALVIDKYKDCWTKFYVDFYVGGLSEEIGYGVLMHDPCTLSDAMRLARVQEEVVKLRTMNETMKLGELVKGKLSLSEGCDMYLGVNILSKNVDMTNVIKLDGFVRQKPVTVLVNVESTHNFVHPLVAEISGCQLEDMDPVVVMVGDGSRKVSEGRCRGFKWTMQGHKFKADMRLLEHGEYDVVLGGQWLKQMGGVDCNFKERLLSFDRNGKRLIFEGLDA